METYEILVGVGTLYTADADTVAPNVDADPGADWTTLGDTDGGVTVTLDQTIDEHSTDQEMGALKATRSEESLMIATDLAKPTMDNLATVLGNSITTTGATVTDAGTKEVGMSRGSDVTMKAFLFRGDSPEMDGAPGQYYVPRGYFGGSMEAAYTQDGKVVVPVEFHALAVQSATDDEKFGVLTYQHEAATG